MKQFWLACYALLAFLNLEPAQSRSLGPLIASVVKPISGEKILPETLPIPGDQSKDVEVVACKGEYEPASIVLHAMSRDVAQITIVPSDLVNGATGARISADNIDIRIVKPWFQSYYAWGEIGKSTPDDFRQILVPELLLKDDSLVTVDPKDQRNFVKLWKRGEWQYLLVNPKELASSEQVLPGLDELPIRDSAVLEPFKVAAGSNKQLWVTLHVPDQTRAGEYIGQLEVRSGVALLGSIGLKLRVLPFPLANSGITYSIYYRGQLDTRRASIGSEFKTIEQMRNELEDMKRHGVGNPTLYQGLNEAADLRMSLKLRQELGLSGDQLFYLGVQTTESSLGSPESLAEHKIREIVPTMIDLSRRYGFRSVFIYGRDEARGPALAGQRKLWRAVHNAGGKVFVAGATGAHPLVGDVLDTFVHAYKPDFHEAERWHASGQRIFSYANPQTGPENPYLFRLNYGLMLWANNYDGAMPYAYQHCFGSCWSDIDDPVYRDHNLTYPTVNGLIPTLAWEGLREAVDDIRYITTLEQLLGQGTQEKAKQRVAAQAFLTELRQELRIRQDRASKYNANINIDLDALRGKLINNLIMVNEE